MFKLMIAFAFCLVFDIVIGDDSVIFIAPPTSSDTEYTTKKTELFDFYAKFINQSIAASNSDEYILAIVDAAGETELLNRGIGSDYIFKYDTTDTKLEDIWIRDFGTVQVDNTLYKFKYEPNYISNKTESKIIDDAFKDWMDEHSVSYTEISNIILDGGNWVFDRESNRVIISNRVLDDNTQFNDEAAFITELKSKIPGLTDVAIIPQELNETTGHSDGMVTFLDENVIGINNYTRYPNFKNFNTFGNSVKTKLDQYFTSPGYTLVTMTFNLSRDKWTSGDGQEFSSARGIYTNILTGTDTYYIPIYDITPQDSDVETVVNSNKPSTVTIKTVDASDVSIMGGAVRCLSWYIWGTPATNFISNNNINQ